MINVDVLLQLNIVKIGSLLADTLSEARLKELVLNTTLKKESIMKHKFSKNLILFVSLAVSVVSCGSNSMPSPVSSLKDETTSNSKTIGLGEFENSVLFCSSKLDQENLKSDLEIFVRNFSCYVGLCRGTVLLSKSNKNGDEVFTRGTYTANWTNDQGTILNFRSGSVDPISAIGKPITAEIDLQPHMNAASYRPVNDSDLGQPIDLNCSLYKGFTN